MSNPVITTTNVTKTAGNRQLLVDVSLRIEAGSLVSLIGPNGAGKSTLINIILGFDKSYTGDVFVAPAEHMHYIPQLSTDDQYQLPISVYEYLSIGNAKFYGGDGSASNFVTALEHVGVDARVLQQSYSDLSGGERQRVAIAQALLTKPTTLVLDEPLAAVDHASRAGLYELIRHLQQDHHVTVLLVSHDIASVLPISDQVLCLNKTLHTDCHPSELNPDLSSLREVHHHCTPGHPLSPTLEDSPC